MQGNYIAEDGTDTRNYGGTRGIHEARELGAQIMEVPVEHAIAAGEFQPEHHAFGAADCDGLGLWGDERIWSRNSSETHRPKLLAPVPGYDRHFVLTKHFGIDLVPVPMTEDGPDMAAVTAAVADSAVKGIWCVPKYSNPTGCTYSDDIVRQIAALANTAAADDFVVLWDNAYAVHDLYGSGDNLASIFEAASSPPAR